MPDTPSPADLSQARIAELLKALTQGPIGDAILGLVRGEMRIVVKARYRDGPYGPLDGHVVEIEPKAP